MLTVHTWVEKAVHKSLRSELHGRPREEPIHAVGFVTSLSDLGDRLFDATG